LAFTRFLVDDAAAILAGHEAQAVAVHEAVAVLLGGDRVLAVAAVLAADPDGGAGPVAVAIVQLVELDIGQLRPRGDGHWLAVLDEHRWIVHLACERRHPVVDLGSNAVVLYVARYGNGVGPVETIDPVAILVHGLERERAAVRTAAERAQRAASRSHNVEPQAGRGDHAVAYVVESADAVLAIKQRRDVAQVAALIAPEHDDRIVTGAGDVDVSAIRGDGYAARLVKAF